MNTSIVLQVISRILTSQDAAEVETLCGFDASCYSVLQPQIRFILNYREKYGEIPDPFTFQAEFQNLTIVKVAEPLTYLIEGIGRNK